MRWALGLGLQQGSGLVPPTDLTLPSISGTAREGQTLTADPGTWSPGSGAFTYQWTADGVNIGGATANTFVLTASQVGKLIRVRVTDTLPNGASASATSSPTSSVLPLAPTNTVLPVISGDLHIGSVLSCSTGSWAHNPTSYAYQWYRSDSPNQLLPGETNSTYTLVDDDDQYSMICSVVATNAGGSSDETLSDETNTVRYALPVNTVPPVISGTAKVGQTLTRTSDGTWTGHVSSWLFQWYRDGVAIDGETGTTYVLVSADHGAIIECGVSAGNDSGYVDALSNPTSAVVYANPVNTVAPVVTGTAKTGQVLSTTNGTFTGSGISYIYQWKRGSTPIGGATSSTYTVVDADHGSTLKCTVTATNDGGAASADSNATSAAVYANPVNTVAPAVTGTAKVGQTLSTTNGTWTSSATPTYTYQWKADGTNIGGATSSTFVPTDTQHGAVITCAVTATNDGGGTSATSNATSAIVYATPVNTVAPVITGTETQGQTLSVSNGTWSPGSGVSYTYQWKRAGTNIGGATSSTYVLVSADVGNTITCAVTATNDGGNASATSNTTGTIASAYALDALSASASAAFAFRKLRSAYAGNCIKVRRSSDNTEQDIGFSSDNLDESALTSFCGAGDGFISKWYDQSGNGRDIVQATQANQPRICLAGVVDKVHSQPAMFGDSASSRYLGTTSFTSFVTNQAWTCMAYAKANSGSAASNKYDARAIFGDSLADIWMTFYASGGTNQYTAGQQNDSNEFTINVTYPVEGMFTARCTTGFVKGTINGGAETSHATSSTTIGSTCSFGAGRNHASNDRLDGYIGEMIFFASQITLADLNLLGAALATRWSQTWTTAT